MKNYCLVILIALVSFLCLPCSAQRIFNNIPSGPGIEKVYISKAAINMVQGSLISRGTNSFYSIRDKIKKIEEIEIVSCENAANLTYVKNLIMRDLNGMNLEPVIEMEDDDEKTVIYVSKNRNEKNETDLVIILNYDRMEISVVALRGVIAMGQ
ncbi:MAG: DUF4252 domain-containing protein [Muribaculaceae bacterium]|nr:DUF4252 domain-containing protein [Muribaculaceae bacterium]